MPAGGDICIPYVNFFFFLNVDPYGVPRQHRMLTMDYEGDFLLVSLKRPRKPLSAVTINSMTTKWLHKQGLRDFSAHSTQWAAASEMINKGQDPMVICALGGYLHEVFLW